MAEPGTAGVAASLGAGAETTGLVASAAVAAAAAAKIVVERLTKNVTEEHLREIFGQYGPIDDMDVPLSRQFGTNRGAAYILYVNEVDAEAAIAHMHEAQLDGATISVSLLRLPPRHTAPTTILDSHLPGVAGEALEVHQEWVAWVVRVGAVLEVEAEAASDEEARLLLLIHTARDRFLGPGRRLRLVGEENTVRGHLHIREADPGASNHRRAVEAEDDTRRNTTAAAARVTTAMVVAIAEAEVVRETAGVIVEQPGWAELPGRITVV
ncbi:hypothetical protein Daus18300_006948 [Diaporthe australafricana]|uniref:RRM domain-containing protein n=1 Tax=Diaporthe australafricana TaxID=127596 RepID=A0ABR3WRG2_9PEZI